MPSIFISHSHNDWRLAQRVQELLESASRNKISVARSSEKGQIKSGERWRDWIDDKILSCDVAVVLLTPASFRGRWVLWEAGAVAGVQYERLQGRDVKSDDPLARRVRVLGFGIDNSNLGPFGSQQNRDGLSADDVVSLVREILYEFKDAIGDEGYSDALVGLERRAGEFVTGAREDLGYTPVEPSESLVQEWLTRLDREYAANNFRWIVAAKRWINVAFLGAENADPDTGEQGIDFRIHIRIAHAHQRLNDWAGAIKQLRLAKSMSPNDLVILRQLGRCYRELRDRRHLEDTMADMTRLDPEIFKRDREGVALRCGYFADLENWESVDETLSAADQGIVSTDAYLANWQAVARMKARGADASRTRFQQLRTLLRKTGNGFWDDATLVNALIALNELDEARRVLESLELSGRTQDDIRSATKYYDDIVSAFGIAFDWRAAAGIH